MVRMEEAIGRDLVQNWKSVSRKGRWGGEVIVSLKAMLDRSLYAHIFGQAFLLIGFTDCKILLHN